MLLMTLQTIQISSVFPVMSLGAGSDLGLYTASSCSVFWIFSNIWEFLRVLFWGGGRSLHNLDCFWRVLANSFVNDSQFGFVWLLWRETWVWSLGREDPLEKKMATHSSTLAWKIPWTEEPGRLRSMGSQRVGHDWATSLLGLSGVFSWFNWVYAFLTRYHRGHRGQGLPGGEN